METQGRMVRMVLPQKHQVCVNVEGGGICNHSVPNLWVKQKHLYSEEGLELDGWRWNIFFVHDGEGDGKKDGGERFVSFTSNHAFAGSLCKFGFFWWCFIILISCQAMMHGFAMLHVGLQTCGGCFWTDWQYSSNKSQQGACFSAKDELRERAHQAEVGLAASVSSLFSRILSIDLTVYHLMWSHRKVC